MLSKLFKHEWKEFSKIPAAILIFLAVITLAGVVFFFLPTWDNDSDYLSVLLVAGFTFYFLSLMACSMFIPIYIAIRYYRNLYGDEGYLMHTLPVSSGQLILSKLSVGFIWSLITGLVIGLSVTILVISASFASGTQSDLMYALRTLPGEFREVFGIGLAPFCLSVLVIFVASALYSILEIYACISLGQLFPKHKVAGAVVFYILAYMAKQILIPLILLPIANQIDRVPLSELQPGELLAPIYLIISGIMLAVSVGMYFLNEYLTRRKLNLD